MSEEAIEPGRGECEEARRLLVDLVDGTLAPEQRVRVELHLDSCAPCSKELRAMEEVCALLRSLPRMKAPLELCQLVSASLAEEQNSSAEESPEPGVAAGSVVSGVSQAEVVPVAEVTPTRTPVARTLRPTGASYWLRPLAAAAAILIVAGGLLLLRDRLWDSHLSENTASQAPILANSEAAEPVGAASAAGAETPGRVKQAPVTGAPRVAGNVHGAADSPATGARGGAQDPGGDVHLGGDGNLVGPRPDRTIVTVEPPAGGCSSAEGATEEIAATAPNGGAAGDRRSLQQLAEPHAVPITGLITGPRMSDP
ncbi:anti-sigma factor [Planctomycetota bacterium]